MSPWLSLVVCAAGVLIPMALWFTTPRRRSARRR